MAGRVEVWKGDDLVCVLVSTVEFREVAQIVEHMNLRCMRWTEGGASGFSAGGQTTRS